MTHPSKMPAAVKDSPNKIFVSNLPKTWDEGRMEKLFETYGKISQVNLMKNKESGESRGFGFITFDTADDANDAIQGMNGKDVEGVQLKVDAALKSLHSSGGGMGDRGGRGGFRGRGFPRGRGGPLMRGGPMGGFAPRGGPRGGFMPRGRGGPYSRGGFGGDRDSGYDGGPPSRGMGRGRYDGPPRGGPPSRGPPRGGPRGAMRGSPRGAPRGRGGPGRPLIDRPPMEEMDQDAGYSAPRGNRPLLGKEPLLQDPGAPEFRQAREPLGHPAERAPEGYRNLQQRRPGMNPDHQQQWANQGRNGGGYSDGGLLPTRQAQWDSALPVRREQEPLMRDREARAPPPMERLTAERPRSSFPPEREASYGGRGGAAATSTQFGEESYGGGARGGAAGRGGGREEFGQSRGGANTYDYAESRPTRAEYGAAASADPLFRSRDPYGAANSDPAPARQTRDSFMERDYAPPARSADPYGVAPSAAASRGYGAREPALPRDAPLSREAPRGRDPLPSRDYAPPARSQRDYAEPRREETVRDYARGVGSARGGYADERPSASFSTRTFEDYEKASSRGYGAASDSFGSARDPAGSTSSSRSGYSSRDPYPSGRGDRAEKPGYGDPFRSAPQSSSYGGRSAPSDRNGGRPYSRY